MESENILQEQKKEAIERMHLLGICEGIINDFRDNDNVQYFETTMGIGYWLTFEMKKVVKALSEEAGVLVYGAIKSRLDFSGDIQEHWSFLFVSKDKDEWERDRADIKDGQVCAYVHNASDPMMSEFGYVGIARTVAGGLRRTW